MELVRGRRPGVSLGKVSDELVMPVVTNHVDERGAASDALVEGLVAGADHHNAIKPTGSVASTADVLGQDGKCIAVKLNRQECTGGQVGSRGVNAGVGLGALQDGDILVANIESLLVGLRVADESLPHAGLTAGGFVDDRAYRISKAHRAPFT